MTDGSYTITELPGKLPSGFLSTQQEDWPRFCFVRVRDRVCGPIPSLSPSPVFAVAVTVASQMLSESKLNISVCTTGCSYEEGHLTSLPSRLHPYHLTFIHLETLENLAG